ncbi:cytochrome P450 [Povalibacter sp.]|uniref:cytochrome P450 n=1 Tax=Povalibacter sp. TaxID=1962978 RepID=UPI002F3FE3A5
MSEPIIVSAADLHSHAHEIFRRYRPLTPLLKRDDGIYIAIRARDVEQLLTDPRTRQMETEIAETRGVVDGPLRDFLQYTMVLSNGIAHRQRRLPLARAFAHKFISDLRPRVRAIAEELIDARYETGEMDFIADFANWLPARVICHILGVPESDIPEFTRCVYSLSRAFSSTFTKEDVPDMQHAAGDLSAYVDDLLMDRRQRPREDFLTSYTLALDTSEKLSNVEAVVQMMTILLGGSDTTRSALAIQASLLLENRDQWEAVCGDPALIPAAVFECLRYEPFVGSVPRVTLDDIALDGWSLPRGQILSLSTLAAMRDPDVYSEPDRFDIRRSDLPRRHLVFGNGVHRCLGAALAKLELEEGLAALTRRLPSLELDGNPLVVRGGSGIRTVQGLRVRWACARA